MTTTPEAAADAATTDTTSKNATDHIKTGATAALNAAKNNSATLLPWKWSFIAAGIGGSGLLADTLPSTPTGIIALGTAATAGITGAAVSEMHKGNKAKIAKRGFTARARGAVATGCAWCGLLPVAMEYAPVSVGSGMPLAWLAATLGFGAAYWRSIRPGYPAPVPDECQQQAQEATEQILGGDDGGNDEPTGDDEDDETVVPAFGDEVVAAWNAYVAGRGTLRGSRIADYRQVEHGWTFLITFERGTFSYEDVIGAKQAIAKGLNRPRATLTFDRVYDDAGQEDLSRAEMTVITTSPSSAYEGPNVIVEDGNVWIEVGPYEDGLGSEWFKALSGQLTEEELAEGKSPVGSMHGAFVLGTKGSGKSRLLEEVAVGLRKIGIELWYIDPQGGTSSPALANEADWPLRGVHGSRRFGNVLDLYHAIKRVARMRAKENSINGWSGFQHTPERPAIMVMLDECQAVFSAENPETGNTFGHDFGELDRIVRKAGIGMAGASQIITLDTFGRSEALRSGMGEANTYILRYRVKGHATYIPGHDGQEFWELPNVPGWGYNFSGLRPHVRWRTRYCDDYQSWLSFLPSAELDVRAQRAAGPAYEKRFEAAAEEVDRDEDFLRALDEGCDVEALFDEDEGIAVAEKDGKGKNGPVRTTRQPTSSGLPRSPSSGEDEAPLDDLTVRQRKLLDLLAEPTTVAAIYDAGDLDVSQPTIRKDLNRLRELHLVQVVNENKGLFQAKHIEQ